MDVAPGASAVGAVGMLSRWIVGLFGLVLAVRLGAWVGTGAGSGWPPDEPYPGLRLIALAVVVAIPVACAVVGAVILLMPWRPRARRAALGMTLIGLVFIGLAIFTADSMVGVAELAAL